MYCMYNLSSYAISCVCVFDYRDCNFFIMHFKLFDFLIRIFIYIHERYRMCKGTVQYMRYLCILFTRTLLVICIVSNLHFLGMRNGEIHSQFFINLTRTLGILDELTSEILGITDGFPEVFFFFMSGIHLFMELAGPWNG